jgi:hypothetical protein
LSCSLKLCVCVRLDSDRADEETGSKCIAIQVCAYFISFAFLREFSGVLEETDIVNVNYSGDIAHTDFNASRETMLVASSVTECSSSRKQYYFFMLSVLKRFNPTPLSPSRILHDIQRGFICLPSLREQRQLHDYELLEL